MVKVMISSDVRAQHVFASVSIVLFTSACVSGMKLQASPPELAECGHNVTLKCEVNSSQPLDIQLFSWLVNGTTVCPNRGGQSDPKSVCESRTETLYSSLTLTLLNVMPVNTGKYLCKLQSKQGIQSTTSLVTVQDCLESSGSFIDKSYAECSFTGVYPNGTVHWFQGGVNLTDSTSTQQKMDQHGRYNISSRIDVRSGNMSLPYNCSLWTPSEVKYRSTQSMVFSSGHIVKLQWICVMVEILMVKAMI